VALTSVYWLIELTIFHIPSTNLIICTGARSTQHLMTALTQNSTLTTLRLNNCNISGFGATHIGENIQDIKHLKTLEIADNLISPAGDLSRILDLPACLYMFMLICVYFPWTDNECQLLRVGTVELCQGLVTNTSLTHLNLSDNDSLCGNQTDENNFV